MATRGAQLNIRTSSGQKSKLAEAARLRSMNVSQFVLSTSLQAADEILADERLVRLSGADYDAFVARLDDGESRDLPQLRGFFAEPSVLEG